MLSDVSTQDNSNNSDEYFYPSSYVAYTRLHNVSLDMYRTVQKMVDRIIKEKGKDLERIPEIGIEWIYKKLKSETREHIKIDFVEDKIQSYYKTGKMI